jgi:predicted permease
MRVLQRALRSLLGADRASALLGDIEEDAARLRAGRWWIAGQITTHAIATAWLIVSGHMARMGAARGMKHDMRFAVRLFRRRPGLFGLTIAGLAIAIAISTTVFSIVKAVAFAGYGVSAPDSVFRVALADGGPFSQTTGTSAFQGNWAFSDYRGLKEAASSLAVVASVNGYEEFRAERDRDDAFRASVTAVSGNYFQVLGLRTVLGRSLTPSDDVPGLAHAVVSHGFWKNRLGADAAILGRTIWLGDRQFTIVGVADRRHSGPNYSSQPPAFWTTLATHEEMWSGKVDAELDETRARLRTLTGRREVDAAERERLKAIESDLAAPSRPWNPAVDVFGRLGAGVTRAQAEAEVRGIAAALAGRNAGRGPARRPPVQLESLDRPEGRSTALPLVVGGIVALVIFLACANVTNVLLASAAGRRREMGTRLAIGASRARIVRQLLTESLMLGAIAGALGLWLAVMTLPAFAAFVEISPAFDVSPDVSVYAFVAALTLAAGIASGLAPARYGRRGDLLSALKTDQLSAPLPLPRARLRSLLIATQAAVSVVLLVVAALLIRAVLQSATLDPGYDARHLLTIRGGGSTNGRTWNRARRELYWAASSQNVRAIPGVDSVSVAAIAPFSGSSARLPGGRGIDRNETSPDYFATLGLRVIRGRLYSAEEVRTQAPVAVISARLAREFWDGADPIGASLERVWGSDDPDDGRPRGLLRKPKGTRVIGIVGDAVTALRYQDAPAIYLPLGEWTVPIMVVRTRHDPHVSAGAIRDAVQSVDPSVRPTIAFPLDGMKRELEGPKTFAVLAVIVGATALGLAVIGLFGVTAFIVEQRAHEVSVRRALGATGRQIVGLLFRDSLGPAAIGLACGLLSSLIGGRVIQAVVYGVSSQDPVAIAAAVTVLLFATTCAVLVPARRAVRVSPAHLLKQG